MINDYVSETDAYFSAAHPQSASATEKPPEIPMGLEEFCQHLSKTERRVTLLGAFHFEMKRQKRLKDTEANYHAAFAVFVTAPA